MNKNTIYLVDQTDIPASFGAIDLILNNILIETEREYEQKDLMSTAENLQKATGYPIVEVSLSTKEVAEINATPQELKENEENDYDTLLQGYTHDDVCKAVTKKLGTTHINISPSKSPTYPPNTIHTKIT